MKEDGLGVKIVGMWMVIAIIIWLIAATVGGLALIKLCSAYLWG